MEAVAPASFSPLYPEHHFLNQFYSLILTKHLDSPCNFFPKCVNILNNVLQERIIGGDEIPEIML
jgi:hypothetical protein